MGEEATLRNLGKLIPSDSSSSKQQGPSLMDFQIFVMCL